jgi:hypothetical protein
VAQLFSLGHIRIMTIKALKMLSWFALVMFFCLHVILSQYFARLRPQASQTESGMTVPVVADYNKIVYVTPNEKSVFYLAYYGCFAAVVGIAICEFLPRTKRKADHVA